MTGKEFIIKTLKPIVLPQIGPLEQKAIEAIQKIELKDGESEVVVLLQVVESEIYAFLLAVNENFEFVRQININEKKSFKLKDLLEKTLESF